MKARILYFARCVGPISFRGRYKSDCTFADTDNTGNINRSGIERHSKLMRKEMYFIWPEKIDFHVELSQTCSLKMFYTFLHILSPLG